MSEVDNLAYHCLAGAPMEADHAHVNVDLRPKRVPLLYAGTSSDIARPIVQVESLMRKKNKLGAHSYAVPLNIYGAAEEGVKSTLRSSMTRMIPCADAAHPGDALSRVLADP